MTRQELEYLRKNEDRTLLMVINEVSKAFHEKMSEKEDVIFKKDETSRKILGILSRKGGLTQNDLVRAIHMKGSTVSVALTKMESMGLIKRIDNPQDMRSIRVYLTEKGYEQSKKIKQILAEEDKKLMRGIAPKDASKTLDVLEIILDNLVSE